MKLRRSSIITILVIVMLCVYAVISLVNLNTKINNAQGAQDELREKVSSREIENDEMSYAISHKDDDSVKARFARDSLELVDPDDKVFYDSGN